MLKSQHRTQHSLYQKNLINSLRSLLNSYKDRIEEFPNLIDRLFYLNLDGVGIATIKDTSSVIPYILSALKTAMTYPYTLYYLRLIDTIVLVLIDAWIDFAKPNIVDSLNSWAEEAS